MRMSVRAVSLLAVVALSAPRAEEPVDLEVIHRIKDEAFNRSEVMDHLFYLTDVNGPRLAGSPGYRRAAGWAAALLGEKGMADARLEVWGSEERAWSFTRVAVQMKEPLDSPIRAAPQAWSAGTDGPVRGEVVMAPLFDEHRDPALYDLAKLSKQVDRYIEEHSGKLEGKIVLVDPARDIDLAVKPESTRHDATSLEALAKAREPKPKAPLEWPIMSVPKDPDESWAYFDELHPVVALDYWNREMKIYERLHGFLRDEGAAAILMVNTGGSGGIIFTDYRLSWVPGAPIPPATVTLAPEAYNRLVRLVKREIRVVLEVTVESELVDEGVEGVNVIAEIPGGSKRKEVVMLGGHLDSWHAGTGATDNAAGCAVAMEAMRILKALDLKMDRTVRIGLWDGEEQGFYGSFGYVTKHFGDLESMKLKPDHSTFSAYFNLDNGGGKIRGVYLQQNDMARPIFEAWFAPFSDYDVNTITIRSTGLTDHQIFDAIGLPGFQFIQDPLEYDTRTHHSDMDLYDHIQPADLMQSAAVMASVVYHAATRDELMPRKPLPPPLPPRKDAKDAAP
jgi:carboxypeptidase Q